MAAPYSFQPVIPVEEAIDLGTRLARGQVTLAELKDANGICGCIAEKYDGEPMSMAMAHSDATLEELGAQLRDMATVPEGTAAAFDVALWLPLIMRIVELILERIGGRGSSPVPGPV